MDSGMLNLRRMLQWAAIEAAVVPYDRRVVLAVDPQGRGQPQECDAIVMISHGRRGVPRPASRRQAGAPPIVVQHGPMAWTSGFLPWSWISCPRYSMPCSTAPGTGARRECGKRLHAASRHRIGRVIGSVLRLSSRLSRLASRARTRGCRNGLRLTT
jgi:hypothetical protein